MLNKARFVLNGSTAVMLLLLAACNSNKDAPVPAESDPAVSGALGDQIVVDPNVSDANGGGKTGQAELPAAKRSPEAIAAAKDEAMVQAGGMLKSAPAPQTGSTNALVESAATAAQAAQEAKAASTDCTKKAQYSATWAAKLPKDLPVYPRGAVQEAAGTDEGGCRLRVVTFVSPVAPKDVVDYYYTRATAAGYGADYRMDGADHVLGGRKGGQSYLVYARKQKNGLTEVDLIASGE